MKTSVLAYITPMGMIVRYCDSSWTITIDKKGYYEVYIRTPAIHRTAHRKIG